MDDRSLKGSARPPERLALRRAPLLCGLIVLVAAWAGPLPHWADRSFFSHMAMHVMVVAVAAPLLALGLRRCPSSGLLHWICTFPPLLASALELVVIWAWHTPFLHHASRQHPGFMALEQGSFLLVALLVWITALSDEQPSRRQHLAGLFSLLMTSMHMTLLGVLLALAPRSLYREHGAALFGLSALEDQALGGVLMLLAGGSAYLLGALYVLHRVLNRSPNPRSSPPTTSVPEPSALEKS